MRFGPSSWKEWATAFWAMAGIVGAAGPLLLDVRAPVADRAVFSAALGVPVAVGLILFWRAQRRETQQHEWEALLRDHPLRAAYGALAEAVTWYTDNRQRFESIVGVQGRRVPRPYDTARLLECIREDAFRHPYNDRGLIQGIEALNKLLEEARAGRRPIGRTELTLALGLTQKSTDYIMGFQRDEFGQ